MDDLARAWSDAGGNLAGHEPSAWSDALRIALQAARAKWPTIEVDDAMVLPSFVVAVDGGPPTRLAELDAPDLFLAAACLAGAEEAAACFMRSCRPDIDAALTRFPAQGTFREDVTDEVFEKMLVAAPSRPARIAEYRGQSSLARWVRVVTVRTAIDRLRGRGRREQLVGDPALLDGFDRDDDPELRYIRERYAEQFRAAFEHAVASLDDRERRLLRERIVHGLGLVQLAALHQTSKSTAARWIAAARARLVAAAHAYLQEHLHVAPDELRSAMRLLTSRLHISVARVLARET